MRSADADNTAGDRNYLGYLKPKLIMNDIRLRGLTVAGNNTTDRERCTSTHRPLGALSAPYERGRPGSVWAEGLDSQAGLTSRIPVRMPHRAPPARAAPRPTYATAITRGRIHLFQ